jgi:hypothetical protein
MTGLTIEILDRFPFPIDPVSNQSMNPLIGYFVIKVFGIWAKVALVWDLFFAPSPLLALRPGGE